MDFWLRHEGISVINIVNAYAIAPIVIFVKQNNLMNRDLQHEFRIKINLKYI